MTSQAVCSELIEVSRRPDVIAASWRNTSPVHCNLHGNEIDEALASQINLFCSAHSGSPHNVPHFHGAKHYDGPGVQYVQFTARYKA